MRSIKLPSWTKRLLGLDPVAVPPHVFALGAHGLAYGSFHKSSQGGFVFDVYRALDLDPGTFAQGPLGGPLHDPMAFEAQLRPFVAGLPDPPKSALLVLPDAWLRLSFLETGPLPRQREAQLEVLRWKLKRLVPFRVEDLRLSAVEVAPISGQAEPGRLLVGFGSEVLFSQLETAFRAAGVRLGVLTNVSLAVLAGLERNVAPGQLAALVIAQHESFTVSFFQGGEPVLYRFKGFTEEMPESVRASSVRRDLRLTTSYVREHFSTTPLARVFLVAPPELEDVWLSWLHEELDAPPEALAFEHLPLVRTTTGPTWPMTAQLLGAACLEVA
ncbi:MAG: hypothetical protein HC897_11670 [Thermoanaerobaculia bacterium]|nr:hypothetical protein [Thermoanaerobaculia bacterium]